MENTTKVSPELYPFTSQFMAIAGHQYHYIEAGEGDPVLMLHGNPSWSFYFRVLIQKLSPAYHCLAPDHIGMGYSDKPDDANYSYTLPQRVKDLEEFLENKGINRNITLIVHDWGGAIGMSYARRHPEAIKKIVILNTSAFHIPEGKRLPLLLHLTRTFIGAFVVRAFNGFSAAATILGVKRSRMSRELRRAYCAPYNSWQNRIATLRFVQDIPIKKGDPGFDYVEDLQNHLYLFRNTPVLIAWGLKDEVFDIHFLNKWIEYLPQAQVHRFEDCGHYVLEDAQEEIGKLIHDFLAN
ncbi:alpha/beta fold hydrolase [Haliscomenobacter sp.]|uniref:alpha/beta fold hydrolase n=1 Tax=Haliscomenobacter sp. TaxID=2717303 RepID=UPI003BAD88F3